MGTKRYPHPGAVQFPRPGAPHVSGLSGFQPGRGWVVLVHLGTHPGLTQPVLSHPHVCAPLPPLVTWLFHFNLISAPSQEPTAQPLPAAPWELDVWWPSLLMGIGRQGHLSWGPRSIPLKIRGFGSVNTGLTYGGPAPFHLANL